MLCRKPLLSVGVGVNPASNLVKSTIMQSFSWLLSDESLSATGRNPPSSASGSSSKPAVATLRSGVAANSATDAAVYKPRKTPRRQTPNPTSPALSKLKAGSKAGTAHSETHIVESFAVANDDRRNTTDTSPSEAAKRFAARNPPPLHHNAARMPKVTVECSSPYETAASVSFRKRAFKRSWSDATLGDDAALAPVTLKKQRSNLNCQPYGGSGPFTKRKMHLEGVGKENVPPLDSGVSIYSQRPESDSQH
ncbi:hypothetical protein SeLEV6574_g04373 [Synchytrium endobioticum]|nr:hypothetical protein SeLEV6574_g04373 [Synchytrium endobioticum]